MKLQQLDFLSMLAFALIHNVLTMNLVQYTLVSSQTLSQHKGRYVRATNP